MNSIEVRKSTRNYQKTPITSEDLEKIETFIHAPKNLIGPYGHQFELELLLETNLKGKEKIGTYGFIKNPQGFIIGKSPNNTNNLFEFGYVFEKLILFLTSIGIGNCWLGGTFKREEIMSSLSLSENEIIPAITPIGYAKGTKHLKERVQKSVLKANQRKPWDEIFFFESFDQPLTDDQAKIFQHALHYVRIGPSAMNKQPWRILVSKDLSKVHFYITLALAEDDAYACPPEYLDIGIAYKHFEADLDAKGIPGKVRAEEPGILRPKGYEYITSWFRD